MSRRLFAIPFLAFAMSVTAQAGDKDNPYKSAKVGDYVTYKITTSISGMNIEGTTKQVVTAVDDKSVTIKSTGNILGMEIPAQESKIDLTKPYDAVDIANAQLKGKAKVKKLKDGMEKVKVGDKTYDCKWSSYNLVIDAMGISLDFEMKAWETRKVLLSGVVKMEMKSKLLDLTLELTESGNTK